MRQTHRLSWFNVMEFMRLLTKNAAGQDIEADSRLRRYRPPFDSFRHTKGEDDQRHGSSSAEGKKGRAVSEVIDDLAGSQSAQRGADPLGRGDGALGQVVASGTPHDIGDHQRREGAENSRADTIEHLDADQPEAVVGEGVEHRPDGQYGEPGEKQGLASPTVGGASDQKGDRQ